MVEVTEERITTTTKLTNTTTKCDLNQFIAAAGTNYLPQVHNNRAISDLNFPLVFEFGSCDRRKCKLEAKSCRKCEPIGSFH